MTNDAIQQREEPQKKLTLEIDAGAKAEAEAKRERMQAAANFMVRTIVAADERGFTNNHTNAP
jgi:hypothetical protein